MKTTRNEERTSVVVKVALTVVIVAAVAVSALMPGWAEVGATMISSPLLFSIWCAR